MVGCLLFTLYFATFTIEGEGLPKWLAILNDVCLLISVFCSLILWEHHKSKIEKLKDDIERLKEKQS